MVLRHVVGMATGGVKVVVAIGVVSRAGEVSRVEGGDEIGSIGKLGAVAQLANVANNIFPISEANVCGRGVAELDLLLDRCANIMSPSSEAGCPLKIPLWPLVKHTTISITFT